jgi:hypothetical protein
MLRKQRLKVYALYICTLVRGQTFFKTSAYTLPEVQMRQISFHIPWQGAAHVCLYSTGLLFSAWRWSVSRNVLLPASCCSWFRKCVTAHIFSPDTNFVNKSDNFRLLFQARTAVLMPANFFCTHTANFSSTFCKLFNLVNLPWYSELSFYRRIVYLNFLEDR